MSLSWRLEYSVYCWRCLRQNTEQCSINDSELEGRKGQTGFKVKRVYPGGGPLVGGGYSVVG